MANALIGIMVLNIIIVILSKRKHEENKKKYLETLALFEFLVSTATTHAQLDDLEKSVGSLILVNKKHKFI